MTEAARITIRRGTMADIPPRPSIVAMCLANLETARSIAEHKAKDLERSRKASAKKLAKGCNYVHIALDLLRKTPFAWVRLDHICAHIEATAGVMVGRHSMTRALIQQDGLERKEVAGKVCWRTKQ